MLISKKVKIRAGSRKFKYYKELGYKFNSSKEIFEIDIKDLTKGSQAKVDVKCDYCGKVLKISYRNYIKHNEVCNKDACSNKDCSNQKIKDVCMIKYGVENPFQSEDVKVKIKKTLNEKYGVEHPMYLQKVKDKIKETCMERYGVENPNQNEKVKIKTIKTYIKKYGVKHSSMLKSQQDKRKLTQIKNGNQLPDHLIKPYVLYRRKVDNMSDRLKKKVLEIWNGYDYYDNEYIRDYFNLSPSHKNYPTLDHKISVYYGFLNNIDVLEIAKIENLCITKNKLNAQKRHLNDEEYVEKYFS